MMMKLADTPQMKRVLKVMSTYNQCSHKISDIDDGDDIATCDNEEMGKAGCQEFIRDRILEHLVQYRKHFEAFVEQSSLLMT
jgi:hypothetical protein